MIGPKMERENRRLREEIERLRRRIEELEEELRASRRQAAPFSKGQRVANPKRPGRKAGQGPFRRRGSTAYLMVFVTASSRSTKSVATSQRGARVDPCRLRGGAELRPGEAIDRDDGLADPWRGLSRQPCHFAGGRGGAASGRFCGRRLARISDAPHNHAATLRTTGAGPRVHRGPATAVLSSAPAGKRSTAPVGRRPFEFRTHGGGRDSIPVRAARSGRARSGCRGRIPAGGVQDRLSDRTPGKRRLPPIRPDRESLAR